MGIEHESARLLQAILDEIRLLRLDLMAAVVKPTQPAITRRDLFDGKKK